MFKNMINKYSKECDFNRINLILYLIELIVWVINFGLYYYHKNISIVLIVYLIEYVAHIIIMKKVHKIKDNDNNIKLLKKIIKENKIDTLEELNVFRDYVSTKKENKIKIPWGTWVSVFLSLILSMFSTDAIEKTNYSEFLNINYGYAMTFVSIFALSLLILSCIQYTYLIIKGKYAFYSNLTEAINYIYFEKQEAIIAKKKSLNKKLKKE